MNANIMAESLKFIMLLSPVIFPFVVVAYADELIDLIKKSVGVKKSPRYD